MKKLFIALGLFLLMSKMTFAQNNSISFDLKDAPVRTTLEMVFKQAGIKNYVIDNEVTGFLTMTITEQPFENSLKLIMRASTIPLTYIKENDVYIVKVRKFTIDTPSKLPDIQEAPVQNNIIFERIPLNYIDPLDLSIAFGQILYIRQFSRSSGGFGMMGGMGGGFGGNMGGFGGNTNNFGGNMGGMGNMGGIGGGNMMGGMGAFGGMGGFGGGRNF